VKVLSVKEGRSFWLMRLEDLNPRGKYMLPFLDAIATRYGFLDYTKPTEIDLKDPKPFIFTRGRFHNKLDEPIGVGLDIWQDGLIAHTQSSTDDADAFLDDLLNWIVTEFGLVPYEQLPRSRLYLSELWVRPDKALVSLNPKLQGLVDHINSLVKEFSNKALVFDVGAIAIWNDRTIAPNNFFSPFRFEKSEVAPFAENRYYSVAPVRTTDHIILLDELEQILAG
jgi:hypothetical protein